MKTIEIKLYKFSELSEKAKETAIENWRANNSGDYWFLDEANATFEKFAKIFPIEWEEIDYEQPYRNRYRVAASDEVKALSGIRLMTYLWNNYKNDLFKGKYYPVKSNKRIFHKRVTSQELKNRPGHFFNAYHSAVILDHSCVLTGVCYDEDILQPIYEYLEKPNNRIDFEDLLDDCINSLCHSVQSEIEYRNSEEAIIETMEANDYDFTENGKLY